MGDENALRELTRNLLVQHSDLSATQARARAEAILREEEYAALEAAAVADARAWSASGRPLAEYFSGTWVENAAAEGARASIPSGTSEELMVSLETQFGSNPLAQGGFDEAAIKRIEQGWAENATRDLASARAAGRAV
jgi:hypothetical protein